MSDYKPEHARGEQTVAIVLAIGICVALNGLIFAVVYDALFSSNPGLSENATQILTGWGGGILSVIGAVVGYRAGEKASESARQSYEQGRTDRDLYPNDGSPE